MVSLHNKESFDYVWKFGFGVEGRRWFILFHFLIKELIKYLLKEIK